MRELADQYFAPGGVFSRAQKGFEARTAQYAMALQILEAYRDEEVALVEAGTGTGKSLAYLLPAVYWALARQERTVLSTHTIPLQEQLLSKDIPFVMKALDAQLNVVLVKGMSNYLCLRRLGEARGLSRQLPENEAREIEDLERRVDASSDGTSLMETVSLPVRERVRAESDSCVYRRCPHYDQCYFMKARARAAEAQILVVNHSLLLTDLSIKIRSDFRDDRTPLPPYSRLVLDEAHHVEASAMKCLSKRVDRIGLHKALARLTTEKTPLAGVLKALEGQTGLRRRIEIDVPALKRKAQDRVEAVFSVLEERLDGVPGGKLRIKEQEKRFLAPLLADLLPVLEELTLSLQGVCADLGVLREERLGAPCQELQLITNRIAESAATCKQILEEGVTRVRWMEAAQSLGRPNAALIDAPLSVSEALKEHLFGRVRTAALCSATLTSTGKFRFVKERLGIERAVTEQVVGSPFDYQGRSLFLVPTDMPDPSSSDYHTAVCERIVRALEASRGNALVLFTSYEMLRACAKEVQKRVPFLCLQQGDDARSSLIETFKKTEGSVLFGADSFWEGVDVPGEALRCVILARLPFPMPKEPLTEAWTEELKRQGKDPFHGHSVPRAVMKFKQGFGRLLRTQSDRGCALCLDKRVVTKRYGGTFLKSLPPCPTVIGGSEEVFGAMVKFYRCGFGA
jgi:ATP-dependent DNA helicase DinG